MSYRLKLIVTISLLIALSFGIGGTLMISTSFQNSLNQETQAALDSFEAVQRTLYLLNSMGGDSGFDSLSQTLSQMVEQKLGDWQSLTLTAAKEMIFQDGNVEMLNYTLPVPQNEQCSYLSVDDQHGQGLVVLSQIPAGDTKLTLTARFDLSAVYHTRGTQQKMYSIIYLAVVAFGILSAIILASVMTSPLRKLTRTVRRITGGDLSRRSELRSHDEIGQLSRDFDAMADKLQENIGKLETEVQRQEGFIGAFAHEMKTPMTSIIGFADLLRQGDLDDTTRMMAAEYIYSEGHRLERLSFKLLDLLLLKKDEVTFKQVGLENYITEVQRALTPVLKGKGIRFICRAQQRRVSFEPDLVKSLIYNIVDNAAKAMDADGIIVLQATAIPGGCQIQVTDNGRGMEQSELTKITEAFYRVDKARSRSQGGAGLGLALCRQIVELHNGNIHFTSQPGKGTCVTVTLYGKAGKADV